MSHHHESDHHHLTLKEKKKRQREKNRRDWILYMEFEHMREKVDISAPGTYGKREPEKPKKKEKDKEVPWSAKLSSIRNRLDNSRRESEDRWNRFAGTTGGGGRGR